MTTSVPTSPPNQASSRQTPDALPARVAGVLRAPRATFATVARAPHWAGVLVLALVVTFACNAALLETTTGRLALLDQWERTAIAFGLEVDDARHAAFRQASENGTFYAALGAFASGPLFVFGLSTALFVLFTIVGHGAATYRQVLAIVAHAGIILALRQAVGAPLSYARETLASPTTLGVFFTTLDEASPLARFLWGIDLFVLWWVVALAIGISVLYARRTRPILIRFGAAYLFLAAVLALVMAVAGDVA